MLLTLKPRANYIPYMSVDLCSKFQMPSCRNAIQGAFQRKENAKNMKSEKTTVKDVHA